MSRWKAQDRTVCIRGTVVCGQAEDDAECGIIVDAHNADIATLKAERDEWKRRCERIIGHAYACSLDSWSKQIIAIAEGRDNG